MVAYARPRSWKSYCLMIRQKSAVFPHILPVLFFTLLTNKRTNASDKSNKQSSKTDTFH